MVLWGRYASDANWTNMGHIKCMLQIFLTMELHVCKKKDLGGPMKHSTRDDG